MRRIDYIVLHCTGGPQKQSVPSIKAYWRDVLKWKKPGYHYLIKPDGTYEKIHPIEIPSNGVEGHNSHSIHISYIGGVDDEGKPLDNRTDAQKATQIYLINKLTPFAPHAKIVGHRDFPGVTKACPSFDVSKWLIEAGLE
jgi:N-acetylmuramoyl-L-alanine amidase